MWILIRTFYLLNITDARRAKDKLFFLSLFTGLFLDTFTLFGFCVDVKVLLCHKTGWHFHSHILCLHSLPYETVHLRTETALRNLKIVGVVYFCFCLCALECCLNFVKLVKCTNNKQTELMRLMLDVWSTRLVKASS